MTRADRVEAERDATVQHGRELDLLVAAQTRVGSTPSRVLRNEVIHHISSEAIREIPYVERDAEYVGGPPGIVCIFLGAAATRPRAEALRVLGQGQMDPCHIVPGLNCPCCGNGRVDATRHRGQYLHSSPSSSLASSLAGHCASSS